MIAVAYHFSVSMGWKPVVYYYEGEKRVERKLPLFYSLDEARAHVELEKMSIMDERLSLRQEAPL